MIAAQIRVSLDMGPAAGMELPTSPCPLLQCGAAPLDLPHYGMGMGGSPCMSGGRAPAYT